MAAHGSLEPFVLVRVQVGEPNGSSLYEELPQIKKRESYQGSRFLFSLFTVLLPISYGLLDSMAMLSLVFGHPAATQHRER